mgnify:CR=1 FL=1
MTLETDPFTTEDEGPREGEQALREAVDEHGEQLAAALEHTDEFEDLLETVVLVVSTADEDEIAHVVGSLTNLVAAADDLSSDEMTRLVAMAREDGDALADALSLLVDLQRDGSLAALLDTARTLSALEVDDDAADGLNRLTAALGDAERTAEPVGPLGFARSLFGRDVRAGLGYLRALLRSLGA